MNFKTIVKLNCNKANKKPINKLPTSPLKIFNLFVDGNKLRNKVNKLPKTNMINKFFVSISSIKNK